MDGLNALRMLDLLSRLHIPNADRWPLPGPG
jgi:hypothetical protein